MMMNLNMSFFQAAGKVSVRSLFLVPDFLTLLYAEFPRCRAVETVHINGHTALSHDCVGSGLLTL